MSLWAGSHVGLEYIPTYIYPSISYGGTIVVLVSTLCRTILVV
jgi:hypothetical protein